MNQTITLSFEETRSLASKVLQNHGCSPKIADCISASLALADADSQASHGLTRIPTYVEQLRSHKVSGRAEPTWRTINQSSIEVKANYGFAYPAINLAIDALTELCATQGIVMAGIVGSHHCGVMGHPVETLARKGFIGIMFSNTPKAMAVAGGTRSLLGTNPIAFACPRKGQQDPLVIDTSLSKVARGKIKLAAEQGKPIPDDWGVSVAGEATSNPNEVLEGSLNPIGGAKGAALAIMIEILAGAFVGSNFGFQASSFFDGEGGPPNIGQLLICMNAAEFNSQFLEYVETLTLEIQKEPKARIPGSRRFASRARAMQSGLEYPSKLIESISKLSVDT